MPASKEERTLANPLYTGAPPYTGAWKDAAYDPELPGRVCTAEQIRVMPTLQQVMVEYSKAVARAAPGGTEQIVEFSAKWFAERAAAAAEAAAFEKEAAAAAAAAPAAS